MKGKTCTRIAWTLVLLAFLTLFGARRLDWLGIVVVVSLLLAYLIGAVNHGRRLTKHSEKG